MVKHLLFCRGTPEKRIYSLLCPVGIGQYPEKIGERLFCDLRHVDQRGICEIEMIPVMYGQIGCSFLGYDQNGRYFWQSESLGLFPILGTRVEYDPQGEKGCDESR